MTSRESSAPPAAMAESLAFTRAQRLALSGVLALALTLRMLHVREIALHDPFFELPSVDGQLYRAWAASIVAGDWLGDGVLILGPLYPYFLALVSFAFGPSMLALKITQALLGTLACGLVALLARRHFDGRTAVVAAAITAIYEMSIFYGGTVMVVNIQVPLILSTLILVDRALRHPSLSRFAQTGAVLGASALARQTTLIFAPIIFVWFWYALRNRVPRSGRIRLVLAFGIALLAMIVPFTIRNYVVGDDFVLINSTGGANLYMAHNPRTDGTFVPPNIVPYRVDTPTAMQTAFKTVAEVELGRELKPSEVSDYWARRALDFVIDSPGPWLALELRKARLFTNAREVWNNRTILVSRDFSWVLRLPLVGFGTMAPLALLGLILCAPRWRTLFPLYAMLLTYLASALIFFVLSRYRMSVVPIFIIFAAHALLFVLTLARDAIRGRAVGRAARAAFTLLALAVWVNQDLGSEDLYMAHFNIGNKFRQLGRYEEAIASYQRSLASNRGFVSTHNNLALALEGAGRPLEAAEHWRHVLAWATRRGDLARAERARRHLAAIDDPPAQEEERADEITR